MASETYIFTYIRGRMKTTKIFKSGNSQAVRIPREFRLPGHEVEIRKRGDSLILQPKKRKTWDVLFDNLPVSDDFMADRKQPPIQRRRRKLS